MGFSTIVSQTILIFTIIALIALVLATYKTYVSDTNISMELKEKSIREMLETNILIHNTTYNATDNTITLIVENTGSISLPKDKFDLFINGNRTARSDLTIYLLDKYNILNPELFDPKEMIVIKTTKELFPKTYLIELITKNGIKNADSLTIS